MAPTGKDRITRYGYDNADRVLTVQSGYATSAVATQTTAYTPNGKADFVKDAKNNCTEYVYDGHDRLSKTYYPSATVGAACSTAGSDYEQLTYDAASNVTNVRLRDGNNVAMTFDNLNRLYTRTPTSEPTSTFTYNLLGQIKLLSRDTTNIGATYDALGRMKTETQSYGSAYYQYDAAGNRTRITWSDGQYVVYDYDNASRVTKIRENGLTSGLGVLATYAYDTWGRRASVTFGNGTSRAYGWDIVDRMAGVKIDLAGTTSDLVIGQAGGSGTAIAYNPASQIRTLVRSNDAYAYNGRTNLSRSYTTNGLNQYNPAGGVTLGYDARGNLTSSKDSCSLASTFTYSKLNELTSATVRAPSPACTATTSTMVYDGLGRMISFTAASATRLTYAGADLIDERNTAGTILRRYVHGPGVDEPIVWYEGSAMSNRRWLQADERGSIVSMSDDAGAIVGINAYDEFGIPAVGNTGRFQYTGQTMYPELGLYNYKARMYSPTLGRFMQTDPIGYADGINWYNYAGGDPVNGTDPTGAIINVIANPVTISAGSQIIVAAVGGILSTIEGLFGGLFGAGYPRPKPIRLHQGEIVVNGARAIGPIGPSIGAGSAIVGTTIAIGTPPEIVVRATRRTDFMGEELPYGSAWGEDLFNRIADQIGGIKDCASSAMKDGASAFKEDTILPNAPKVETIRTGGVSPRLSASGAKLSASSAKVSGALGGMMLALAPSLGKAAKAASDRFRGCLR